MILLLMILVCCSKRTLSFRLTSRTPPRVRLHAKQRPSSPNDEPREPEQYDDTMEDVSDTEALLAVYAYLQKRNQLGLWRSHQTQQPPDGTFFWDDPEELKYLNSGTSSFTTSATAKPAELLNADDEEDDDDKDNDDRSSSNSATTNTDTSWSALSTDRTLDPPIDLVDVSDPDDVWENAHQEDDESTYFKLDDVTPRVRHEQRSQATKERFQDPQWKRQWYQARWGNKRKQPRRRAIHKKLTPQLLQILSHPAVRQLNESDIQLAIQQYRSSSVKRSRSLKKRRERQTQQRPRSSSSSQQQLPQQPRDSLLTTNAATMEQKRQARSEKAARAYQTRLQNQKEKPQKPKTSKPRSVVPVDASSSTPHAALARVERALDDVQMDKKKMHDLLFYQALLSDVKLCLTPTRLSNRRPVLLRLLRELFELRGKCVPLSDNTMEFITTCSMDRLGKFVSVTLRQRIAELEMKTNNEDGV